MARKPRKQQNRDIRNTFYIFCEGKSEKAYIEFLRQFLRPTQHLLPVVCKSNISDKEVQSYMSRRKHSEDDRMFAMYDIDVEGMYQRVTALKGVTPLLSNPCIELWFLLHFTDHTRSLKTAECIELLKKQVNQYKKGEIHPELDNKLRNEIEHAIERARKLSDPDNPSTSIWHLLEILKFR